MTDAQYARVISPDDSHYIEGWIKSVLRKCEEENFHAFILHNGLSNFLMNEFYGVNLTFVDVSRKIFLMPDYSPNDLRFLLYSDFIEEHSEVDFFFFTDVSDVEIVDFNEGNLLRFYERDLKRVNKKLAEKKLEEILFTQLETGINSTWSVARVGFELKYNEWFINMFKLVYPDFNLVNFFEEPVLNCGLIGGHRSIMKSFMRDFAGEILRVNPTLDFFKDSDAAVFCVDMPVFNYLIRTRYENVFYAGFPVHNVFAANDRNPFVWFRHK